MGGQSSRLEGAREDQLNLYGVFDLRQRQKFSITVLSDLVTMLVDGNNLFNLAEVLNSPEGCNSLMTLIQKKLDREFLTLQLPDPKRGEISKVSFMPKSYYEKVLKSDEERRNYCQQFVRFIVRFTGLVAALTASVAYQNEAFVRLKDLTPETALVTSSSSLRNPQYKDLVNKQLVSRPISAETLSVLTAGKFKQVYGDTRPLYTFNPTDSVVVDIQKGIVYNAQSSPTGVLGITFTPYNQATQYQPPAQPQYQPPAQPQYIIQPPVQPPVQPQYQPIPQPQRPASVSSGAQGWNAASTSTIGRANPFNTGSQRGSILGGGTRRAKHRRGRKGSRKQRGGDRQLFTVTLTPVGECEGGVCQLAGKFLVDTDGMAYGSSDGLSFVSFANKINSYLTAAPKYALESGVSAPTLALPSTTTSPAIPISLAQFNKYKSAIRGITDDNQLASAKDVTSPAFYRAFLLATAVNGKQITTTFCTDVWTGAMTDTIPYALLQSLYDDNRQGGKTSESAEELNATASRFLNNNIASATTQGPYNFSQLRFIEPKTIANKFCATGNRIANTEAQYNVLTNAHRRLRGLYDTHLGNVEKFVRKILSLKDMGYRKAHQIRVDPIFVTSKQGALETLEGFIKEARTLLANHYLEVETTYKTAITDISKLGAGQVPASALEKSAPVLRTKNVEDATMSSDPLKRSIPGKVGDASVSSTA